jgi:hypothetical protein
MTPGDRVTQLYPQALGAHLSRLLRQLGNTYRKLTAEELSVPFNDKKYTGKHLDTERGFQTSDSPTAKLTAEIIFRQLLSEIPDLDTQYI